VGKIYLLRDIAAIFFIFGGFFIQGRGNNFFGYTLGTIGSVLINKDHICVGTFTSDFNYICLI